MWGKAKKIHRSLRIFVNKEKFCQNNNAESQNLQTFGLSKKFRSWHKGKESEKQKENWKIWKHFETKSRSIEKIDQMDSQRISNFGKMFTLMLFYETDDITDFSYFRMTNFNYMDHPT